MVATNRILVKLRPTNALRAAESRANLRPLYETPPATFLGVDATPQWFIADLPDGGATPWDLAHAQVASQLGVAESDVLFAEPDVVHSIYRDTNEEATREGFAVGADCTVLPQDAAHGKAVGPADFAWHLNDDFSQLGSARSSVAFSAPLTRIAHIDTGYFGAHVSTPRNIRRDLERNFVERDGNPGSAEDPNNKLLILDNSGHGTGTISILAGFAVPDAGNLMMGGAPGADIVPLRVADSVVLLRTSALARALEYAIQKGIDVITMSMGGLPSNVWAEAVDKVYEAGICFCAAAGNHTGSLPPKVVVYPARYPRVIAVCGVMADGRPYANLQDNALEGSFGPDSAMKKAIAAYTPNIPWARFGCDTAVRRNGEGTSAATPQVAAAAALYFEKYKSVLQQRDFRRVEAVRNALFSTAKSTSDKAHFGNGVLQARRALDVKPVLTGLPMSERSQNSFAFLRLITGLGITEPTPREQMFNLEVTQRWMMNEELQQLAPDPDAIAALDGDALRRFMGVLLEDSGASNALRKHVAARYPIVAGGKSAPSTERSRVFVPPDLPACDFVPDVPEPPYRRLRVYALDPSLSTRLATASISEGVLKTRWTQWEGGASEYIAIDDVDAAGTRYAPVDLNDPRLLVQDGWSPSERNPQFHQQMVYAVAMKTIEHFEKALGRPVLWRTRPNPEKPFDDSKFTGRLVIRPHALRQANAFYSPNEVALHFGYFDAGAEDPGEYMPGSRVYSCLSHDIIAHETTHAILDGMFRRFSQPSNLDVLAFHEAFADIVALLQHFTIPEVLESEITRTRGDVETESILGSLAVQFGKTMGGRGALRNAIGKIENGVWKRYVPDATELQKRLTPHARGAVLVAAVFDALIAIYNMRVADLLRISTGGTGVLPTGAIHPDLVRRLADEAAKAADRVLTMCIRALDYLPPVDITFFEYLRGVITADFDLVSDGHNYRVAFLEAFRARGIYPLDLGDSARPTFRTLSVDTLRWQGGVDLSPFTKEEQKAIRQQYGEIIEELKRYADRVIYLHDRKALFEKTRVQRIQLHRQLKTAFETVPAFAKELGLDPAESFEVHALRSAVRITPEGKYIPHVIVMLTQSRKIEEAGTLRGIFLGGATLVVDLTTQNVKYKIIKNIDSEDRRQRAEAFVRDANADPLRAIFLAPEGNEVFSVLHSLAEDGL